MNLIQANIAELVANAVRTATLTPSTGVDISAYDGALHFILQSSAATAGTTPTLNCKLQHSDEADDNFADVTGATFAEVTDAADITEMITRQASDLKKYIRVVCTVAGTDTPTFGFGVSMVGCLHSGRNASQAV